MSRLFGEHGAQSAAGRGPHDIIYQRGWWQVDPRVDLGPLLGWLVLKPRRHVELLDERADDEAATLAG